MGIGKCPEETRIVDLLLERLPEWEGETLLVHFLVCPRCREAHETWKRLLALSADGPVAGRTPIRPAVASERAGEEGADAATGETVQPAPGSRLKRRMRMAVTLRRWRGALSLRRLLMTALAALAFPAFGWWLPYALRPGGTATTLALDGEVIRMMDIAARPHTVRYALFPSVPTDRTKGFAWVDKAGNELLLLVEGAAPADGRDYQAWFVSGERRYTIGILRWTNGKGYLRYRGEAVESADEIAVSLEPKGGSVRPTGPDAVRTRIGGER